MRLSLGYLVSPALAVTGFRFSKEYRRGISRFHRAVYRIVDTVAANLLADALSPVQ